MRISLLTLSLFLSLSACNGGQAPNQEEASEEKTEEVQEEPKEQTNEHPNGGSKHPN